MEYINTLKTEVENTLGRKVLTSTDCRHLYYEIARQQNKISFNTLRRFFYLMKSDHKQSPYTLDALSNYCGFTCYSEFMHAHQEVSKTSDADNQNHTDNAFLHYLISFFKCIEVRGADDTTFTGLVEQTIIFLQQHPHLIDEFQRKVAHTANGQLYYYELCIQMNKLAHFYGDGLRYYMNAKRTADSKLFATYLLGLKSWLLLDDENLLKYYKMQQDSDIQRIQNPLMKGYKFVLQLYYSQVFNSDTDDITAILRNFFANHALSKINYSGIFNLQIHIIQAMVMCKLYDEALSYIENVMQIRRKHSLCTSDLRLFECVPLFMAISLYRTGETTKAKEVFNGINPSKFHFLHKQYLTILYLLLKKQMRKGSREKKQLHSLIEITGFKRLAKLF